MSDNFQVVGIYSAVTMHRNRSLISIIIDVIYDNKCKHLKERNLLIFKIQATKRPMVVLMSEATFTVLYYCSTNTKSKTSAVPSNKP
jgi:hypothetical protein